MKKVIRASSNLSIREKVAEEITTMLYDKVEDNLALVLSSKIHEYDPSWSMEVYDASSPLERRHDEALHEYVQSIVDILFEYAE